MKDFWRAAPVVAAGLIAGSILVGFSGAGAFGGHASPSVSASYPACADTDPAAAFKCRNIWLGQLRTSYR
jgi:hypothetical protein